jgi:hypothetical protein
VPARANLAGHGADGPIAAARPGQPPAAAAAPARAKAHVQSGRGTTAAKPRGGQWPAQWPIIMITAAMGMLAGMLLMAALLTNSARQQARLELGGQAAAAQPAGSSASAATPAAGTGTATSAQPPSAASAASAPGAASAGHGTGKPMVGSH